MRVFSLLSLFCLVLLLATSCARHPVRRQADPVAAGFGRQTFASFDLAMHRAIDRGEVPGGVLAIGRNGAIVYLKAWGVADPEAVPQVAMRESARFDVASLTKPMVTASAAALAACDEEYSLEEQLRGFSIDEHLRHMTNVPLYLDWQVVDRERRNGERSPGEAITMVLDRHEDEGPPLQVGSGYSNLGYLLVGEHIEDAVGSSLEEYLRARMWGPLGMTQTSYHPDGGVLVRSGSDIEPGRPFDPLADYVLRRAEGRSPGHSGLFSTARDVSFFAQALMDPNGERFFGQQCVADYLLSPRPASRVSLPDDEDFVAFSTERGRTPAFLPDRESPDGRALYHTGYTGTLLWIDPETRTSLVLLTNTTLSTPGAWDELRRELLGVMRGDIARGGR